jgi:hypothetical protein
VVQAKIEARASARVWWCWRSTTSTLREAKNDSAGALARAVNYA